MGRLRYSVSMSLDGFVAGKDQSTTNPLGVGGHLLHEWMRALAIWREEAGLDGGEINASTEVIERGDQNVGAVIMGRNMFGGGPGPWSEDPWNGWWGDNPPFHTPVFVLTRHPRPAVQMDGGTTFHFLDTSPAHALAQARQAAGGRDVRIGGGPSVIREFLAAGLIDYMHVVVVPIVLGRGERLWDRLEALEDRFQVEAVNSPSGVTHVTFSRR
jgi:dihydrofolate reductase